MNSHSLDSMIDNMLAALLSRAGSLVEEGNELTWKLFGIVIAWQLLQIILSDSFAEGMAAIMNAAIKTAFVLFLLGSWNGGFVSGFFTNTMNQIAKTVAGNDASAAAGARNIVKIMHTLNNQGDTAIDCSKNEDSTKCPTGGNWWERFWNAIPSPVMEMVAMLLKFVTLVLLGIMLAVYVLIINIGAILTGIGLTFGPILVPWLLLEAGAFLFDGWLKFMIAAGLMKAVGALMMVMTNSALLSASALASEAIASSSNAGVTDWMAMIFISVMTAIGAFMMWQVPSIADGLIRGTSGARVSGFGSGVVARSISRFTR